MLFHGDGMLSVNAKGTESQLVSNVLDEIRSVIFSEVALMFLRKRAHDFVKCIYASSEVAPAHLLERD